MKKDSNPLKKDSNLWLKVGTESLHQEKDSLNGRSEKFGKRENGSESLTKVFESPRRILKQKVEKRKGFESPQEDPNPSSRKMKNKAKDLNLCKKDSNPFINK